MKQNLTEIVFILDQSGSMCGLEADTVGGFNSMIKKQKEENGEVFVSTVLFSDNSEVLYDRVDIKKIEPMTERNYNPHGCTALLDAVGDAIHHIGNIHKYARPEDVPENTIFVITTDGMENASRRYSSKQVKDMIKRQEEKYGWEFMFLAADINAVETAERIGIRRERSANYCKSKAGTGRLYETVNNVIVNMRSKVPVEDNWKDELGCEENKTDLYR